MLGSIMIWVYFVAAFISIAWLLYQGFSTNSKLNKSEPKEDSSKQENQ